MSVEHNAIALFAALLLEGGFGYPNRLFAAIGHPVTWIGTLIARLDSRLNRDTWSDAARRTAGITALGVLLLVVGGAA